MWFIYALAATLAWGAADLFYKKGADARDKYSHLKTSITVGLVMGVHAILTLIFSDFGDGGYQPINLLIYLPVSLMYILSMTVGYLGLRYLELSISSPVQNSSGAVVCLMCLVFLGQRMDTLSAVAVALICVGVLALGILEKRREAQPVAAGDAKYVSGFKALMFPLLYCIIDALGTFFDAYYLDDIAATPLVGVSEATFENVANVSYELTFLIVALLLLGYLLIIKKERFSLRAQRDKGVAALFETGGQLAYVYAMSGNAVVAAPMIAAYSIVSVLLSRIFLKEKLGKVWYMVIGIVMAGIALLGLAEGLAE